MGEDKIIKAKVSLKIIGIFSLIGLLNLYSIPSNLIEQ